MIIEYYYSVASPFAYLGSKRFQDLVKKYKVEVLENTCDLVGGIFTKTGGLPLPQRSPERQKYRLDELKRWSEFLNIKLNLKPKFFPPTNPHLPNYFVIASIKLGKKLILGHELLKNLWSDEKDISDIKVIEHACEKVGLSFKDLSQVTLSKENEIEYKKNTEEAIANGVFGAPTYIFDKELFWGQDRINFLELAIQKKV